MSWYEAGTVTSVAGTNVITGVGTLWNNPIFGIASGQMIFIPGSGQVVIYEILAVDSDTKIRITRNIATAITNSEYAIVTTVSNSMSDLARRTAVQLALYQKLLEDWQDITTGTGNVSIIAPDGTEVIMPSFNKMNININSKLPLTGGTLTGPVILAGDATDPKGAVTKQQLDAKPAGALPLLHSYPADTRDHIEEGTAPQDGQLLSRALFPDAWAAIQATRTVITDAAWLADPLNRGCFSSGDGSTTFRLPDKNGKSSGTIGAGVPRGDGTNSSGSIGTIQRDASQNFTGAFSSDLGGMVWLGASSTSGVFSSGSRQEGNIFQPKGDTFNRVSANGSFDIDISRQIRTAAETRMLNFTVCWVIKLAGSAFNEGQINALELATQITLLTTRITTLESDAFTNTKMTNTPWINLTLGGGWSGSVYRYRKVLGMAQLQVSIVKQSVVNGEVVATLPSGYRPTAIVQSVVFATFSTPSGGGATYPARVIVSQDGALAIHQTNGATELNFVLMFPLQ
ncbi:hypothetical protein ACLMPM_25400 [Yersinia enterocolitica]|uniref:hypothetical protein n=1 Tax=Yersinia enterocolitica TaxID=630 RepID=UPI00398D4E61